MTTAGWLVLTLCPLVTAVVTALVLTKKHPFGFHRVYDNVWPFDGLSSAGAISFLGAVMALMGAAYGLLGLPMWVGLGCMVWMIALANVRYFQIKRYVRSRERR
ncbi:MAG: hypothetical protein ACKVZJ_15795 [Phycisphaerales bacterium]